MVVSRRKPDEEVKRLADMVQDTGNTDYVLDGVLYQNAPVKSVIVPDGNALADLEGYEVGTVAYTAGFGAMWQLSANGEWVSMI